MAARCGSGNQPVVPRSNSFTGEDVLELQGHGGAVILDLLLKRILFRAAVARPGDSPNARFYSMTKTGVAGGSHCRPDRASSGAGG